MTDNGRVLRIGELAARTGVSVKAIREYERLGLVYTAGRTPANYRRYPPEAIACIEAIKRWRSLGFTLKEMVDLARIVDTGPQDEVDHRLLGRLRDQERALSDQIVVLERQRDAIRDVRARAEAELRRGTGARARWQAMQEQARDDYLQRGVRAPGTSPSVTPEED
jgi:DNA-binding transcriptional MerR regulator